MPFPNEHAARLRNPNDFAKDSFRRTEGGTIFGRIKIPKSVGIIWGKLKGADKPSDFPLPQSLRFPKDNWTAAAAKKFIKDNKINAQEFESASDKAYYEDDELFDLYIDDDIHTDEGFLIDEVGIKHKTVDFEIKDFYEEKSESGNYGYIEGYASTFDKDRGGDVILPGAFKKTIKRHKKSGNRPIRMFFQHDRNEIIGGFPISKVKEDEKGLKVVGQINLDVQKGQETYSLARQGVLSDMSIGYSVRDFEYNKDEDITYLKDIELWEVSIISEPMNTGAQILSVKAVTAFRNLPLAPENTVWDGSAAEKRVRKFTNAEDAPNKAYRDCFMWYDADKKENFTSYKLLYCDVIDGKLKVVPHAIFEKAALLHGGRAGLNIPEADKKKVAAHVNKYYDKMGLESPLKGKSIDEYDCMKDIEEFLKNPTPLSGMQRKIFISKIKEFSTQRDACVTNEDERNLRDVDVLTQKIEVALLEQKADQLLSTL